MEVFDSYFVGRQIKSFHVKKSHVNSGHYLCCTAKTLLSLPCFYNVISSVWQNSLFLDYMLINFTHLKEHMLVNQTQHDGKIEHNHFD